MKISLSRGSVWKISLSTTQNPTNTHTDQQPHPAVFEQYHSTDCLLLPYSIQHLPSMMAFVNCLLDVMDSFADAIESHTDVIDSLNNVLESLTNRNYEPAA